MDTYGTYIMYIITIFDLLAELLSKQLCFFKSFL